MKMEEKSDQIMVNIREPSILRNNIQVEKNPCEEWDRAPCRVNHFLHP